MFEITGALTYILPAMIVVGVTKAVSSRFAHGGIADRMIWFNGFPYLDTKGDHSFGVPVSQIMISEGLTVLPCGPSSIELHEVEKMLRRNKFQGFPIVRGGQGMMLMGYLGRTELVYGIERARLGRAHLPPETRCYFNPPPEEGGGAPPANTTATAGPSSSSASTSRGGQGGGGGGGGGGGANSPIIDFSIFIDPTPLTVHPSLPLETVMEIFKKIGPRVILIEHRGRLCGLVTIKDCLAYQAKAENRDLGTRGRGVEEYLVGSGVEEGQEKLWAWIVWCVQWVSWRIGRRAGPPSEAGSEIILFSDEEDGEWEEGGSTGLGRDGGWGGREEGRGVELGIR